MPKKQCKRLDPNIKSEAEEELASSLKHLIVGQTRAIEVLVDAYETFRAGLAPPDHPVGNLIFLGPTGCGKTYIIEVMAELLFGTKKALKKVDCAEFQHSHEISKLVGCFITGTRVMFPGGTVLPIEKVEKNASISGENGEPHPVIETHSHEYAGEIVKLTAGNTNIPVGCTPWHEIRAIQDPCTKNRATTKRGRLLSTFCSPNNLKDIAAGDLKAGDVVVYPRHKSSLQDVTLDLAEYTRGLPRFKSDNKDIWSTATKKKLPRFIPVSSDFMRLAGFYVSEGGNSKSKKSINFTFGKHGQDSPCIQEVRELIYRVFGDVHIRVKERKSSYRIYLSSRPISLMMTDLFGDHALRKRFPAWVSDLRPELAYDFLDTAILGDGGKTVCRRIDYATSSETLAFQIQFLLHNLGYAVQMQEQHPKDKRGYKASTRYRLYVAGDQIAQFASNLRIVGKSLNLLNLGNSGIQRMSYVDDDYIYTRIKKIERELYKGMVYDLSIKDKSYYMVCFQVHNSPPGYLGHRDTPAYLRQESLDAHHTEELKLTLLLFDEFEKSNDALWNLLLGILDKGTLTLGDNKQSTFDKCLIIMTGNLGSREMQYLARGGLGFAGSSTKSSEEFNKEVETAGLEAAKKRFTPEFLNRIDEIVVFHSLDKKQLKQVVELEIEQVQSRVLKMRDLRQFVLEFTPAAKDLLITQGTDLKNGARPLKRIIEKLVVKRLSRFLNTKQVNMGDLIVVDKDNEDLSFTRVAEGVLVAEDVAVNEEASATKAATS
jgi:DNA polymerase III delta prime subunit